jgi:uncharacterized membrane protein
MDHGSPSPKPHAGDPASPAKPVNVGLGKRLRTYFFAGVLVTAPIAITIYLTWQLITFVDGQVKSLIPAKYNPETYLPFATPGLGIVIAFVVLTLIGFLTANIIGRSVQRFGESLLDKVPVIRSVYKTVKQIFETVLSQQSKAFREAVLIEYPRRGMWAIGFITGRTEGEVQDLTQEETINVFLPTTPNPTSGFLLFVPRKDVVRLAMNVEEAIKMVVSGGLVTPPDRRPPEKRTVHIAAADSRDQPEETPRR